MTESRSLGIPGLTVIPGSHICAFYKGLEERDQILIPYLQEGLRAGDKCICVIDATDPDTVLAALGGEAAGAGDQLDLLSSMDAYLLSGKFRTEDMMDFWDKSIGVAMAAGGFPFSRAVGEMTWALRDFPGVEELVGYESELNRFLPLFPQVILCLYDLDHFNGELLVDILKTHPKVLMGRAVLDNPYYLDPDEFLASRE